MPRNHWNTTSKIRQAAYKHGYKSGLELTVSEQITVANYPLQYETQTVHYIVPESKHKYTPDFVFTKKTGDLMFVETKGRWTTIDPNQRISKNSKTTYESYANKLGITHVAKRDIPAEWLAECVKNGETPNNPKKFFG